MPSLGNKYFKQSKKEVKQLDWIRELNKVKASKIVKTKRQKAKVKAVKKVRPFALFISDIINYRKLSHEIKFLNGRIEFYKLQVDRRSGQVEALEWIKEVEEKRAPLLKKVEKIKKRFDTASHGLNPDLVKELKKIAKSSKYSNALLYSTFLKHVKSIVGKSFNQKITTSWLKLKGDRFSKNKEDHELRSFGALVRVWIDFETEQELKKMQH